MSTVNFTVNAGGSGTGSVGRDNEANFAAAHDTADGETVNTNGGNFLFCDYVPTTYNLYRTFLPVNTSAISDGAEIISASLFIYLLTKNSTQDDTITIVATTQTSTATLATTDYNNVGTISGGVSGALSTLSINAYTEIALNATGLTWIDKTGTTKIGLRFTRDIANSAPGNRCYCSADLTTNLPYLAITYKMKRTGLLLGIG